MNWHTMFDPAFELELLNGDTLIVKVVFLFCITWYVRQLLRGKSGWIKDWYHLKLEDNVNFAIAVFVADLGVCVRAEAIWFWRRFMGGGEMPLWLLMQLWIGGVLIIMGGLCEIRTTSIPIRIPYTNRIVRPWAATTAVIAVFTAASIYFR